MAEQDEKQREADKAAGDKSQDDRRDNLADQQTRLGEQGQERRSNRPAYDYNQNRYGREGEYYRERGGAYDLKNDYQEVGWQAGGWQTGEPSEHLENSYPAGASAGQQGEGYPKSYTDYNWRNQESRTPIRDEPFYGTQQAMKSNNRQAQRGRQNESWMVPGPMSGVGPRGYRRSDQIIQEEACERLTQHGQVDARQIQIQVNDGIVTLEGTVDSRRAKRLAEDAIHDISGVFDVQNHLRVQSGGQASQT